jgi:AraC family transcriptional regulator
LKLDGILALRDPLSGLAAEGLGIELLSEALRPPALAPAGGEPDWLRTVNQIVHDRYRESLSLAELALAVGVHPVHLARAFRRRYGSCVGELIRHLRTEAACHALIRSNASIAEIAVRNGFADQSHLCRILKRKMGMTPGEYRKCRLESSGN